MNRGRLGEDDCPRRDSAIPAGTRVSAPSGGSEPISRSIARANVMPGRGGLGGCQLALLLRWI